MVKQYFKSALVGTAFLITSLLAQPVNALSSGCVMDSWGAYLSPDPQEFTAGEEIQTSNGIIHVFKFGALKGEHAKVYIFLLDNGTCFTRAVSFGSYAMTNLFAEENGDTGADGRLYHGDIYDPDSHSTIGFYEVRPTYDQALKIALEILK